VFESNKFTLLRCRTMLLRLYLSIELLTRENLSDDWRRTCLMHWRRSCLMLANWMHWHWRRTCLAKNLFDEGLLDDLIARWLGYWKRDRARVLTDIE
jgi:hypothetical protein